MRRAILLLALLAAGVQARELRNAESEMARLLERVRPSIVTVITPNPRDRDASGVVVSSDGVILTLRTLLLDKDGKLPDTAPVRLAGAKTVVQAEVIDTDPESDTALLRVKAARGRTLKCGTLQVVKPGEWVLLVGNTFGSGRESTPSASLGVVSGLVRGHDEIDSAHISALVNPGSVGAPVIDFSGNLLGIVAPRITSAGGQTIVVSIDRVRRVYRASSGGGKRVFSSRPAPRSSTRSLARAFGLVMADAARRGQRALVGVRSAELAAPPEKKKKEEPKPEGPVKPVKPVPEKPKPRKPRGPRRPKPVRGQLGGYDRSSGVVVANKGGVSYVLCPLRVTGWPGPRRKMTVDLLGGSILAAEVAGVDERLRIALLRVQRADLPLLKNTERSLVRSGRFALALGFPHEFPAAATPQVTIGILSRTGALANVHPAMSALQTDAGVAGGNRGGPLVDMDGNLMGVLLDVHDTNRQGYGSRRVGSYAGNAGLGFALPMDLLDKIIPRLIRGEEIKPGYLGVSTEPVEEGLKVTNVSEKNSKGEATASSRAGLKVGDLLVELSGKGLRSTADLIRLLAARTVGDAITLVWTRAGKRMSATVKLGER